MALRGNQEAQAIAEINDPDHLVSFIDEVQNPQIEGAPNYLRRFRNFEDVIHSLAGPLNLGRNLQERLIRHALASELLSNLSVMVERNGSGAYPRHRHMSNTREEISITTQNIIQNQSMFLSYDHVISLALALVSRTRGEKLNTKVIEESLDRGVFLTFNPSNGVFEESALHKALRQTVEDIQALRQRDDSATSPKWDSNLLNAIAARPRGHRSPLEVASLDMLYAFSYYDLVENVFNGHLALCRVFLGLSDELESYARQPITPLGEQEEQKLRAERVSPAEIAHLIQNNIWPLGTKVLRQLYGKTREEQVQKIADSMRTDLTNAGIDANQFPEILKKAAEQFLDKDTALPGEGIEELSK
jgi:hypothetical protein